MKPHPLSLMKRLDGSPPPRFPSAEVASPGPESSGVSVAEHEKNLRAERQALEAKTIYDFLTAALQNGQKLFLGCSKKKTVELDIEALLRARLPSLQNG